MFGSFMTLEERIFYCGSPGLVRTAGSLQGDLCRSLPDEFAKAPLPPLPLRSGWSPGRAPKSAADRGRTRGLPSTTL